MNALIRQLVELCEIDRAAEALREQLARYPKMLAGLEEREETARKAEADAKARHKAAREALRKIELEIAAQRELIGKFKLQQGQVKKNEEYQALTREIQAVLTKIDALETVGLQDLEAESGAEAEIKAAAAAIAALKKEHATEGARIEGQVQEKTARLRDAEEERRARLAALSEDLQDHYELLNGRYPGAALAPVREGCCGGCNTKLVTQRVLDARHAEKPVRCDNCTRILYDPSGSSAVKSA